MAAEVGGGGDGPVVTGGGAFHEEFKEIVEVRQLLLKIPEIVDNQIAVETTYERFQYIIDQYQEQPHLLDPHLEELLSQLLGIIKSPVKDDVVHLAFKFLYLFTKTRGFKIVLRLMPHEVADLAPLLAMLDKQDPYSYAVWETRYMLLLWLSIVCMIPFDMSRLDSSSGDGTVPTMSRIVAIGQTYLTVTDKSRDATAYMLSRFMTRPDVKKLKLPEFMDWCETQAFKADFQTLPGEALAGMILRTLGLLFKQGKREDLIEYVPRFLQLVGKLDLMKCKQTMLRKMATKLIQRLALTLLKARVAQWRYQRGSRSLVANLTVCPTAETIVPPQNLPDDDEYDIPDEIEDILEYLLTGLKDKDTIVRWSAAKGVGRITGRLPKELADDVVLSILSLFTVTDTDGAWHGGCLSLAELGRRGLLLPQHLKKVVPIIIQSLNYDEKRANFSIGAHVRDSACYVCWAFARAYDPQDFKPFVSDIANALVIVSIFDREINVRRAAAAAFQENVGRQGQFPHGIEILTTCDYFAVGNRNHSYLELSGFVAQFDDYRRCLIDHLYKVKSNHWDIAIRDLAGRALHNLTSKDDKYMLDKVLPELLKLAVDMDLNQRHGALLAIGDVVYGLYELYSSASRDLESLLTAEVLNELKQVTLKLKDRQLFKGMGGELMRKGVCYLIEKLSMSKLNFHDDPVIADWQELIDSCLEHVEPEIQAAAYSPIPAFFTQYYQDASGRPVPQIQESILRKYLKKMTDNIETTRVGYTTAIGFFPSFFISGKLQILLPCLAELCMVNSTCGADTKKAAVKALSQVCITVGFDASPVPDPTSRLCESNIDQVWDALFAALKDYTMDSRGDVGAWIREAAMTGLYELTVMMVNVHPELILCEISRLLFCNLIQQAVEKIDRTRALAGEIFFKLLHLKPDIPRIPHKEKLLELFPMFPMERNPRDNCLLCGLINTACLCYPLCLQPGMKWQNFAIPSYTFPRFTHLLVLPTYTYHLTLGLVVSVGGLTESLVKASSLSLLKFLREIHADQAHIEMFAETLLQIFRDYLKQDRVTLPLLKTVNQLLTNDCFELFLLVPDHFFPSSLLDLIKQEISRCGDTHRLLASSDVFCSLLQFQGSIRKKILFQLAILLCHKFPLIRKNVSAKLYEALIMDDSLVNEENLEQVMALLSETQWDQPLEVVRDVRNTICDLMDIGRPVLIKSKTSS